MRPRLRGDAVVSIDEAAADDESPARRRRLTNGSRVRQPAARPMDAVDLLAQCAEVDEAPHPTRARAGRARPGRRPARRPAPTVSTRLTLSWAPRRHARRRTSRARRRRSALSLAAQMTAKRQAVVGQHRVGADEHDLRVAAGLLLLTTRAEAGPPPMITILSFITAFHLCVVEALRLQRMPVRIPAVPRFVLLVLGLAVLAPAHAAEIGGSEGGTRPADPGRRGPTCSTAVATRLPRRPGGRRLPRRRRRPRSSSWAWATTGSQSTTTPSATQCSVAAATTW